MAQRTCTVEGCERPHNSRGWCRAHYKRWRKTGEVRADKPIELRALDSDESFAARTSREGDCLVWTGATNGTGYGLIASGGAVTLVHRWVWERTRGAIPDGMFIDHACWNRACCNVAHLRLATISQNGTYRSGARSDRTRELPRNVELRGKGTYCVRIKHDGVRHYFGPFASAEEAAAVASRERDRLFGEFAGRG